MKKLTKFTGVLLSFALVLAFTSCISMPAKSSFSPRADVKTYEEDPLYWNLELVSSKKSVSKVYKINNGEFFAIFPAATSANKIDNSVVSAEDLTKALIVKSEDCAKIVNGLKTIDSGYNSDSVVFYDFQFYEANTVKAESVAVVSTEEPAKKGGLLGSLLSKPNLTSSLVSNTNAAFRAQVKNTDSKKKVVVYSVKGSEKEIKIADLEDLISNLSK